MSDPAELNSILEDLAAGRIDADQAATRIAELNAAPTPTARRAVSVESLYDSPPVFGGTEPQRAPEPADEPETEPAAEETEQVTEPVTEPAAEATEQPKPQPAAEFHDAGHDMPLGEVPGAPVDEPEPDASDGQPSQPSAAGGEKLLFSFDMDDVTATAGEVLGHAGDFAKSAFARLGEFASGVVSEGPPAPAAGEQPKPEGPARPTGNKGVERVILRSVGRRVRLIGDPKVSTISVDGPHTLRRQGVTLEVNTEGEIGLNLDSFSVIKPPKSVEDLRVLGLGRELVIRVNPAIPVDAEVTGSKLTTVDVPYLGKIRVSAGAASLTGVVEITDALMQAGSASLTGPLSSGRSQVRVESGNLSVRLTEGANVTIRSTTQLGRVSWPGEPHGDLDEFVVGNGSAKLEIGVVMGRAVIRVDA